MSAKHTSGPWTVGNLECSGLGKYAQIVSNGQFADIVARVCVEHKANFDLNKCGQANARLIAAAPTMAEYIKRRADAGDVEATTILEAIHA